jgi:KDO2-lipid IV(A) lauroyltransferase
VYRVIDPLVYAAFRLVWAAAALVPLRLLRGFLDGAAGLAAVVDRRHRDIVKGNLAVAFPDWPPERVRSTTKAAFANWGRIGAEVVHAERFMERYRNDSAYESVAATARELMAGGRGLVVLTAHTANFELFARILCRQTGIRLGVFHRAMSNALIDDFLTRERAKSGFINIGRGAAAREALEMLAEGAALAVPLDQNQKPGRGVFVDFFGEPAATTPLLARLAIAAGVPILPVFAVWDGDRIVPACGTPRLPEAHWPRLRGPARDAAVAEITQWATAEVERVVRAHPAQWNWAHRRWKTRPDK